MAWNWVFNITGDEGEENIVEIAFERLVAVSTSVVYSGSVDG